MDRAEIDGRQHRCDQARLRSSGRFPSETVTIVGYKQAHLLSHEEAKIAGGVMHDRWERMVDGDPPLLREDAGWTDLARAAWEEVWASRRTQSGNLQPRHP